jgi:glycosyltransferase involved in cell wall biosynthesis
VVCKEKVRTRVEPFLRQYYRTVPLLVLADEPNEIIGSYLLNKVRSEKVAFMPEGSAFCFPNWEAIERVPGSIIPLVGQIEYPSQTAWIRQQNADGWLCRTRTAIKYLAASNSLEEWRCAEILKNTRVPVLSTPPLTPLTDEPMPEIVGKKENPPVITSQSRVMAIVPHYKCNQWLFQCLESLVNQIRPPDAVVVVDDNSPQPPVDIVIQFPQVTLMTTEENVGPYRIIQQVIDDSDFDAYMFQDADDWSSVDRLELLLKEAERTGAQLVGCQELWVICSTGGMASPTYYCNRNTQMTEEKSWNENKVLKYSNTGGMASPTYYCSRNTQMTEEKSWNENKVMKYSNTGVTGTHQLQPVCYPLDVNRALRERSGHALHHPTSIVSKDLVQQVGGFATGLRFGGDTEFLWRAVWLAPMANIPGFCYFRRQRPGSLTTDPHSGLSSPARKELLVLLKKRARENMARCKNGQPLLLQPLKQRPPVVLKHLCGPKQF